MWCLVIQPNSVILEVEVEPKAKGQECLSKVCNKLGISHESDYFGLKIINSKGEDLWLNLRNSIEYQMRGITPFRFALRVKFWVPPHLLLQDTTRHQFYLNICLNLKEGRLRIPDWNMAVLLIALMAQAETGDIAAGRSEAFYEQSYSQYIDLFSTHNLPFQPQGICEKIFVQHTNLAGMKSSSAKYWLLKEVSNLTGCGEELFQIRSLSQSFGPALGIGPHGISVYDSKFVQNESLLYSAVINIAYNRRQILLRYLTINGEEHLVNVKLESTQSARSLYRAIIEKHAFYSCETVKDAVTTQFIRDLKGTVASIFKEDSTLGLKYVFDIQRTRQEVYDNARRSLHQSQNKQLSIFPSSAYSGSRLVEQTPQNNDETNLSCSNDKYEECKGERPHFREAMLCRICMDQRISAAIFPCAHVMCCIKCAEQCMSCPMCRAPIRDVKQIFLAVDV